MNKIYERYTIHVTPNDISFCQDDVGFRSVFVFHSLLWAACASC